MEYKKSILKNLKRFSLIGLVLVSLALVGINANVASAKRIRYHTRAYRVYRYHKIYNFGYYKHGRLHYFRSGYFVNGHWKRYNHKYGYGYKGYKHMINGYKKYNHKRYKHHVNHAIGSQWFATHKPAWEVTESDGSPRGEHYIAGYHLDTKYNLVKLEHKGNLHYEYDVVYNLYKLNKNKMPKSMNERANSVYNRYELTTA